MSLAENEGKGERKPCSLLLLLKDGGEELEPLPRLPSLSSFTLSLERKKKFSVPLGKCKERREEEPLFRKLDLRGCLFLGLPAKQEAGLPPFLRVIYAAYKGPFLSLFPQRFLLAIFISVPLHRLRGGLSCVCTSSYGSSSFLPLLSFPAVATAAMPVLVGLATRPYMGLGKFG